MSQFNFSAPKIKAAILLTMRQGSISAKNHFLKSFTDGGFTDVTLQKWTPRKKETSKTLGKGILIKTGALRRSIRVKEVSPQRFVVVSDLGLAKNKDYAPVHNFGEKAGRGKGFIMPKRQFIGHSTVLENKIRENLVFNIDKAFM